MKNISESEIVTLVRKNMDEQFINESGMLNVGRDNVSIDTTIKNTIPEALDATILAAPDIALEGEDFDSTLTSIHPLMDSDILEFAAPENILRLLSFKAKDSEVVLHDFTTETSFLGRMQLNKYLRGTSSDPVLVKKNGSTSEFKYYCLATKVTDGSEEEHPDADKYIETFNYVPFTSKGVQYSIPTAIFDRFIYRLTALVLIILNEPEKATAFMQMATAE